MRPRAEREALLERQRAMLARGDMSDEEKAEFACLQRQKDHEAWLRIRPQQQLELPEAH